MGNLAAFEKGRKIMATVMEIKNKMLDKMAAMDLDKLTLMDANQYVDILSKLASINEKSYPEILADVMSSGFNSCNAGYTLARLGDTAEGK